MLAQPSQRRSPHVSHVLFALNVTSLLFGDRRTEPPPSNHHHPWGLSWRSCGVSTFPLPLWDFQTLSDRRSHSAWELEPSQRTQHTDRSAKARVKHDKRTQGDPDRGARRPFLASWCPEKRIPDVRGPDVGWMKACDARRDVGVTCWCCGSHQEYHVPSEPEDGRNHHRLPSIRDHRRLTNTALGREKDNVLNHFFPFTHTRGPFEYVRRHICGEQSCPFLTLGPFSSSVTHNAQWR